MGIKSRIEEKAMETQQTLAAHAQMKYLSWLMKEEQCDYNEALAIVQGRTDPLEPEYMLGYKLADPVVMIAIFKQHGKNNRLSAARNFAATLTEEERKTVKKNFKNNVLLMAAGFVLGYLIGRMIFTELRMLAYVTGMVVAGVVCALYIKK